MILYLDTSALVKRYVRESGSEEVSVLIEQAEVIGSSLLTQVEMASALSKAVRLKWVDADPADRAWRDFMSHWQSVARLSMTPVVAQRASRLAWEHGMRAYDAAHLAAALIWQESLESPVTLASYDRELWSAAQKEGMAAWPER